MIICCQLLVSSQTSKDCASCADRMVPMTFRPLTGDSALPQTDLVTPRANVRGTPAGTLFRSFPTESDPFPGRPVLFPSGLHSGLPDFVRIPFVCTRIHCPSHSTSGLGSIWHSDVCILTVVYIAVLWRGEYLRFDLLGSPSARYVLQ